MMTNDIATAYGDVILVLEDTARLRVSSIILSSASPVFKIMFGPTFLEGQGKRSAESPKEVSLIDDDPTTMTRLCRLLHHQLDQEFLNLFATQAAASQRAQELYNLAVLSDKYNCTDSIKMPGGYLLSQFGLDSVSQSLPSDDLLALIYAAYTMGDCRYFAFFTRCLVLDAAFNYSTIVKHHVVANLPNSFLLLVEEQRRTAFQSLEQGLSDLATRRCYTCDVITHPSDMEANVEVVKFKTSLTNLSKPDTTIECSSLRQVLKELYKSSSSVIHKCPKSKGREYVVTGADLKGLCNKVSNIACGLCFTCLKDTEDHATCTHRHLFEQWVNNDPIS